MPSAIEIPRERWEGFLATFSQRNGGRMVRLEVEVPPGEGTPLIAEHQPLLGISYDEAGSEAPAIEISLGGPRGGSPNHLSHVIEEPTRIWVDEEPDGLGIALQVLSRDEGETRVLFEREAALNP